MEGTWEAECAAPVWAPVQQEVALAWAPVEWEARGPVDCPAAAAAVGRDPEAEVAEVVAVEADCWCYR